MPVREEYCRTWTEMEGIRSLGDLLPKEEKKKWRDGLGYDQWYGGRCIQRENQRKINGFVFHIQCINYECVKGTANNSQQT